MPRAVTCAFGQTTITVDEALKLRDDPQRRRSSILDFRCNECGQPVRPHKESSSGAAAHIEHQDRNADCSLSPPPRSASAWRDL